MMLWEIPFSVTYSQLDCQINICYGVEMQPFYFICVLIVWTTFLSLLLGTSFASKIASESARLFEWFILFLSNVNCMIRGNKTVTMNRMCITIGCFESSHIVSHRSTRFNPIKRYTLQRFHKQFTKIGIKYYF